MTFSVSRQLVARRALSARRRDLDVVQGHDARQRRDPARELAELVVRAGQADLDRLLGVEVLAALALGLEQLLLEPAPRPVWEMSTSRFGISVLPGNWRSMVPKERSISASWAL